MRFSSVRARTAARLPARAAWRSLPWADAGHAAVVSAVPVILAVLLGEPRLGWSAIAAFWACLADPGGPLPRRTGTMAAVALVGALYCFLGSAAQHVLWLLLPLTFLCCTIASLAQLTGPSNAIVGALVCAGFVVSTELPTHDIRESAAYAIFFIGGGVWAIVMTALVWRRRPWRHATAAVAGCFVELGDYAHALGLRYMPSPAREARRDARRKARDAATSASAPQDGTHRAHDVAADGIVGEDDVALRDVSITHRQLLRARIEAARARVREVLGSRPSRGERGQQLLALLDAAEAGFVVLVALSDTLAARPRNMPVSAQERIADASILRVLYRFGQCADGVAEVSDLTNAQQRQRLQQALALVDQAVRQAHASARTLSVADDPTLHTVLHLLTQLLDAGATATAVLIQGGGTDRTSRATPPSSTHANHTDAPQSGHQGMGPALWRRLGEMSRHALAVARRELHPRTHIARHALRVGIATTLSVALCKSLALNHGYWISLTVVFVLQPYLTSTWQRAFDRIAGSVIGAVGAALVGILLPSPLAVGLAVLPIAIGTFVGRTVHYALFTFFVTLQFVLVAEIQQPAAHEFGLAALRALNSIYGGLLGLAIGQLLWPERGGERLARVVADALDRHATYVLDVLRGMLDRSDGTPPPRPSALKSTGLRREACVAADNAQVLLRALRQTPLQRDRRLVLCASLVEAMKALTAAATVLELQPWRRPDAVPPANEHDIALRRYADDIAAMLRAAARWLRDGAPAGTQADFTPPQRPALPQTDGRWLALARLVSVDTRIQDALQTAASAGRPR
ncbi:FUSC family protein [Robbsia andropogonis]|uniref:FUSC family protein n=1 Tax=Robbsia andropogonis TaxID=28092 RepID=UPI0006975539|nr:FUSC family protein [Robbsia andropogonis]